MNIRHKETQLSDGSIVVHRLGLTKRAISKARDFIAVSTKKFDPAKLDQSALEAISAVKDSVILVKALRDELSTINEAISILNGEEASTNDHPLIKSAIELYATSTALKDVDSELKASQVDETLESLTHYQQALENEISTSTDRALALRKQASVLCGRALSTEGVNTEFLYENEVEQFLSDAPEWEETKTLLEDAPSLGTASFDPYSLKEGDVYSTFIAIEAKRADNESRSKLLAKRKNQKQSNFNSARNELSAVVNGDA